MLKGVQLFAYADDLALVIMEFDHVEYDLVLWKMNMRPP